jgi:hypothetical protein
MQLSASEELCSIELDKVGKFKKERKTNIKIYLKVICNIVVWSCLAQNMAITDLSGALWKVNLMIAFKHLLLIGKMF